MRAVFFFLAGSSWSSCSSNGLVRLEILRSSEVVLVGHFSPPPRTGRSEQAPIVFEVVNCGTKPLDFAIPLEAGEVSYAIHNATGASFAGGFCVGSVGKAADLRIPLRSGEGWTMRCDLGDIADELSQGSRISVTIKTTRSAQSRTLEAEVVVGRDFAVLCVD